MPNQDLSRGQKAIEQALKEFNSPTSDLHRKVERALKTLKTNHSQLLNEFGFRMNQREEQASKRAHVSIALAEADLKKQQAETEKAKKLNDKTLTGIAENFLKVAEGNLAIAKQGAVQDRKIISSQNQFDRIMRDWIDGFVEKSVEALASDAAADSAIALLSGGLIVGGVVGGPVVVAAAATASAAILIYDMRNRITRAGRGKDADRKTARVENALPLIQCANDLADRWLQILRLSRVE